MTFVLEREFERKNGLRAHGSQYTRDRRVNRHIKSGGEIILHRLSEDILTSNVFGILEKLEVNVWLKALLTKCFDPMKFPQLFSEENFDSEQVHFHFWHELDKPIRPKGHEEGPTQVDLLITMPKSVVSFEIKFGAELSPYITTDLPNPQRKRPGVSDPSLWWNQVIRNIERGYVYTRKHYPQRSFFFIILAMEKESKKFPFYSRYKEHPDEIRRQIESGYRWKSSTELRKYFDDNVYDELSNQIAWITWKDVQKVLLDINFRNPVEETFKEEVIEYINNKIKIYQENKMRRLEDKK